MTPAQIEGLVSDIRHMLTLEHDIPTCRRCKKKPPSPTLVAIFLDGGGSEVERSQGVRELWWNPGPGWKEMKGQKEEIGRASCRERV